jgi:putative transposase
MRAAALCPSSRYPYGGTAYANPDAATQIANGLSTTTFSYDADGNVTQKTVDGTSTTYVYDYANRLTALGVGGATTTYGYDAFGQRVLLAIIDWASRAVLAWRLSNTMDTAFCVEALQEALARFGKPDIFNTDQGAQFTSAAFTGQLQAAGIRISMDGRGRWMDNVFIERVWRSLKYEEVHLKAYTGGHEARAGIGEWMIFYNTRRFHQALGYRTPMAVWSVGKTAMDMPLRLDNARALPTCPQPQQQQQTAIAA